MTPEVGAAASDPEASPIPTERTCPFDPPDGLRGLPAVSPLRFASGAEGWLVTDYRIARSVLRDSRFSTDRKLTEAPIRELPPILREYGTPPGMFNCLDGDSHARYRRLLAGYFSAGRIAEFAPRAVDIVDEQLTTMAEVLDSAGEADLLAVFAMPVSLRLICELLGVPDRLSGDIARLASVLFDLSASGDSMIATILELREILLDAIRHTRASPSSGLIADLARDPEIDDEELFQISQVLLLAGFETTANMLALSTFALLSAPDQLRRFRAGEVSAAAAVDELLRYLSVAHMGPVRAASESVRLGEVTVAAGQSVMISVPVVNRDPALLDDADRLLLDRPPVNHISFGVGAHKCIGQYLARTELEIGLTRLFARFPTLTLAVPPEQVPLRTDMLVYGVHELLVGVEG